MRKGILLFGGTSEGRKLAEFLDGKLPVTLSVATEYGRDILPSFQSVQVRWGRMDESEMQAAMPQFELVIDATHPYAVQVSEQVKKAAEASGTPLWRLVREGEYEGTAAQSHREAAQILNAASGRFLLTVGSKELEAYTAVTDFSKRAFVRILPQPEAIAAALQLGYEPSHLLAMQGPFSLELNRVLLRDYQIETLVTKDSGSAGGFDEKRQAAEKIGCRLLVIGRQRREEGISLCEMKKRLEQQFLLPCLTHPVFPLFLKTENRRVLVVGGGAVALRRIQTLLRFQLQIQLVSPRLCPPLEQLLSTTPQISYLPRTWQQTDCGDQLFVVAATDEEAVNRQIADRCNELKIPVSRADSGEDSTFFFPAIVGKGSLIIGISSDGKHHGAVRDYAAWLRKEQER
ncbi:MAG: precorrin-6A reductase [Oscillospiraceae bacterium]|nr:precorrin-6A reductase [Oscillospiraceae bacterium]